MLWMTPTQSKDHSTALHRRGWKDSVGVANSDDEDWLQRAKQRINAATEQMKQTAAEIKDDDVEKR